jgi:hypothetical protein
MTVSCCTATAPIVPVESRQVFVRNTPNKHTCAAKQIAQQPAPAGTALKHEVPLLAGPVYRIGWFSPRPFPAAGWLGSAH